MNLAHVAPGMATPGLFKKSRFLTLFLFLSLAATACAKSEKGASSVQPPALVSDSATLPKTPEFTDPAEDPCPDVSIPKKGAAAAEMATAMTEFLGCIKELFSPVTMVDQLMSYFKRFELEPGATRLSSLSEKELVPFLGSHRDNAFTLFGVSSPQAKLTRNQFSDADLLELKDLSLRRLNELFKVEGKIFAAMDLRRDLLQYYATVDRWAVLLALRETAGDSDGVVTSEKLVRAMTGSRVRVPDQKVLETRFPRELLHPHAILSVILGAKTPMDQIKAGADPFTVTARFAADFSGNPARLDKLSGQFRTLRNQEAKLLIEHEPPAMGAAHVALIDSGVDFVKRPELAAWIGRGGEKELASYDYSDQDGSVFAPLLGDLAHGTGTASTILTVLTGAAPDVLAARKFDLGVWKSGTSRSVLSGPAALLGVGADWESRYPIPEAIIENIDRAEAAESTHAIVPQVVSASVTFDLAPFLAKLGREDLLLQAPWLWVMAAGNQRINLDQAAGKTPACLGDIKPENRNDARILCVGAVKRGASGAADQVARYSNTGSRVEIYTYDTFTPLCPTGTSCAAPGITGAAAAVMASVPGLAAEQLKTAILSASIERELEVEALSEAMAGALAPKLRVKFFDPMTMTARAIEEAKKLAQ